MPSERCGGGGDLGRGVDASRGRLDPEVAVTCRICEGWGLRERDDPASLCGVCIGTGEYAAPEVVALPRVFLYTDGAYSGKHDAGGWGVVLEAPRRGGYRELSGGARGTTNNRMELEAVIQGLRALRRPCRVHVVSDSTYVLGSRSWSWLEDVTVRAYWDTNVRGRVRRPKSNADQWRALLKASAPHVVTCAWIRGHVGHPQNTRADALAVAAREDVARR